MRRAGVIAIVFLFVFPHLAEASYHFSNYRGTPPLHLFGPASRVAQGMTPENIKAVYHLPQSGGTGTIAIIGAYDDTSIESDLAAFSAHFHLPACTSKNGCFTVHKMSAKMKQNSGWALETSLDVEWAHAIAPNAKILLIEATTPSGANLIKAVDYAAAQKDASAISMSWGGAEFPEEVSLDSHFTSVSGAPFFASSGDNGTGASWPAASPRVIAVGGTTLSLKPGGAFSTEIAWSGSGGGVSAYESEPAYQKDYNIAKAAGMRAIPDVSYDADPASGFPIYRKGLWRVVGGTSAGAPQWAAIAALGSGISAAQLYTDKSSSTSGNYFRDVSSGSNGDCGYYCDARTHYDYVTGLGSPLTTNF